MYVYIPPYIYIILSPSLYTYSYKYIILYTGDTYYRDVWVSNDLGASWQRSTNTASWTARRAMGVVSIGGTIILMGGYDGEYVYILCSLTSIDHISILLSLIRSFTHCPSPSPAYLYLTLFMLI